MPRSVTWCINVSTVKVDSKHWRFPSDRVRFSSSRAGRGFAAIRSAISRAFGTPKPTLSNSYEPELLNLRTFPTLMGYSSRIMAESWESNSLYWAALADELSVSPTQLNVRIPEWTRKLVEQIFASHLEDWPAVLKSLRFVGDDVRAAAAKAQATEQKAAALQ